MILIRHYPTLSILLLGALAHDFEHYLYLTKGLLIVESFGLGIPIYFARAFDECNAWDSHSLRVTIRIAIFCYHLDRCSIAMKARLSP